MFISLRNHTTFSLCKGAIKIQELIDAAIADKMPALGICDCGNLFAALEFSTYCKKAGIQPILSAEMLVDFGEKDLRNASNLDIENSLAKMPLIAATEEGYKNLMYLVSYSFLNRENGLSPHIKFALLKEKSKGLIALSGAVEGIVGKMLHDGQEKKLDSIIVELQKTFSPQNFYIEITRHGTEVEKKLEEKFIATAFKHNAPLVATNDVYFISEEMHEAQDILNCIGEGRFFIETDRKKNSPQQYFKTQKAMEALFADLPEALENTVNIAKKCSVMAFERPPTLPKFSNEKDFDEKEALKNEAYQGLRMRLAHKFEMEKIMAENAGENLEISKKNQETITQEYFVRLDYELSVISKMNFSGYFLIVSDFIIWSKKNDIPVGPGRGSGAGSVVAWSLQITDLDPIRFGLLFERFLNPDRVSMPDFDIDFCQSRRDEVIKYVQQKYGKDFVAQIITFGKLQARAVLKDVGRVLQMPYNQVDRICKLIPFNAIEAVTLDKAIEMDKDLQQAIKQDPQVTKLVDIALKLEGLNRHASTHAAGVVIGDKPLTEICALYCDDAESMPAVGYSMKYAENAGLVKFDFLGLKTLTTTYIRRKHGDEKTSYPHPLLEPTLRETHGVIVYQEQVMEIAKVLAGYSLGAADLLRRAMGKKIKEEMDAQRKIFVDGAIKNGVGANQASEIFDLVDKFAGYGFNKSHAAAYALISYQTAYLKANFPVEFLVASINLEIDNTDKINVFLQVAKDHGIKILPPSLNESEAYFSIEAIN